MQYTAIPLYSRSRRTVSEVDASEIAARLLVASLQPHTGLVDSRALARRFLTLPADLGGYGASALAPSDLDIVADLAWDHASAMLRASKLSAHL